MNFAQKRALVEALLACPSIRDRPRRDQIIAELPFRDRVPRSAVDFDDVFNLVNTAFAYDQGIETVADRMRVFEGDSEPVRQLFSLLDIPLTQVDIGNIRASNDNINSSDEFVLDLDFPHSTKSLQY